MSNTNNFIPAKGKAEQTSSFDRHNISDEDVQENAIENSKLESPTPELILTNSFVNG